MSSIEKTLIDNTAIRLSIHDNTVWYENLPHPDGRHLGFDRFKSRRPFASLSVSYDTSFGQRMISKAIYVQSDAGVDYFRREDEVPGFTRLARLDALTDGDWVDDYTLKTAVYPSWKSREVKDNYQTQYGSRDYSGGGFELRFARPYRVHTGPYPLEMVEAFFPIAGGRKSDQPYLFSNFVGTSYVSPDYLPSSQTLYHHSHLIAANMGWSKFFNGYVLKEGKRLRGRHVDARVNLMGPATETLTLDIIHRRPLKGQEAGVYEFVGVRNVQTSTGKESLKRWYGDSATLIGNLPDQLGQITVAPDLDDAPSLLSHVQQLESLFNQIIPRLMPSPSLSP